MTSKIYNDGEFYIKPYKESLIALGQKLSGATYEVLELMSASSTFHNDVVFVPPVKQIAQILRMSLSNVYKCLARLKAACPFLKFQTSACYIAVYRTDPDNPKNFFDFPNLESIPLQRNLFQKFRKLSQNVENQQLELLPDKDFISPKTIQTDHTPQTGEGVDEKINEEEEASEDENAQQPKGKDTQYTVLPNHQKEQKVPPSATQKKYKIPDDLLEKLRMFEIKTSEQVLRQISEYHISQAYGAIAHVENTFETIRDKTAVFLYQLPKQPVEKLGARHDEELLAKQKQEVERIDKEKQEPSYFEEAGKAFDTIKQIFKRKEGQAKKKGRD